MPVALPRLMRESFYFPSLIYCLFILLHMLLDFSLQIYETFIPINFRCFLFGFFFFCTSSWIWGVSNFKLKSSCSQMLIIFEHFGPILNVSRQLSCKFKKANKQDFFFYHAHWCCLCKQSSVLMFVLYILFLSNHDFSVL